MTTYEKTEDLAELSLCKELIEWKEAAAALKIAEIAEDRAREKLVHSLQFLGYDRVEKFGVKAEKVTRKGSVEYKAIPELYNVDLEMYRRPEMTYWSIKPSVVE